MKFFAFTTLFLASMAVARPSLKRRIDATATMNGTTANTPSATSSIPPSPTGTNSSQTSLTLLSSVIAPGFSQNGQNATSDPGQVPSLTSTNNFINWCATVPNLPITNGQQLSNGSCNPAPIGAIPSISNMPSVTLVNPPNFASFPANQSFQIQVNLTKFATGFFVNPDTNFLAAPQQLDPTTGQIQGLAHFDIQSIQSLTQTTPTNVFSKSGNFTSKADAFNRVYSYFHGGLPVGVYRLLCYLTGPNYQPVVLPNTHYGSSFDVIYPSTIPTGAVLPTTSQPITPCRDQ